MPTVLQAFFCRALCQIVQEVVTAVDGWRETAHKMRIARSDIEWMAGAFTAHEQFRHAPKCGKRG